MPRTSHFSYPSIVISGLGSFFYPGKGFINVFLRRSAYSTSWILTYGGNFNQYKFPTYSKILKRPAAYKLNLRLDWSVCQPLRNI